MARSDIFLALRSGSKVQGKGGRFISKTDDDAMREARPLHEGKATEIDNLNKRIEARIAAFGKRTTQGKAPKQIGRGKGGKRKGGMTGTTDHRSAKNEQGRRSSLRIGRSGHSKGTIQRTMKSTAQDLLLELTVHAVNSRALAVAGGNTSSDAACGAVLDRLYAVSVLLDAVEVPEKLEKDGDLKEFHDTIKDVLAGCTASVALIRAS